MRRFRTLCGAITLGVLACHPARATAQSEVVQDSVPTVQPGGVLTLRLDLRSFRSPVYRIDLFHGTVIHSPMEGEVSPRSDDPFVLATFEIPDTATAGVRTIAEVFDPLYPGGLGLPVQVNVATRRRLAAVSLDESIVLAPGKSNTTSWEVRNLGNAPDTVRTRLIIPAGWPDASLEPPFTLAPGEAKRFNLMLAVPDDAGARRAYDLRMHASGSRSAVSAVVVGKTDDGAQRFSLPLTIAGGQWMRESDTLGEPVLSVTGSAMLGSGLLWFRHRHGSDPLDVTAVIQRRTRNSWDFRYDRPGLSARYGDLSRSSNFMIPVSLSGQGADVDWETPWGPRVSVAATRGERGGHSVLPSVRGNTPLGEVNINALYSSVVMPESDDPVVRSVWAGWEPLRTRAFRAFAETGSVQVAEADSAGPWEMVMRAGVSGRGQYFSGDASILRTPQFPRFLSHHSSDIMRGRVGVQPFRRFGLDINASERVTALVDETRIATRSLGMSAYLNLGSTVFRAGREYQETPGLDRYRESYIVGLQTATGPFRGQGSVEVGDLRTGDPLEGTSEPFQAIRGYLSLRSRNGEIRAAGTHINVSDQETSQVTLSGRQRFGALEVEGVARFHSYGLSEWRDPHLRGSARFQLPRFSRTELITAVERKGLAPVSLFLGMETTVGTRIPIPSALLSYGRVYDTTCAQFADPEYCGVPDIRLQYSNESISSDERGRFFVPQHWTGRVVRVDAVSLPRDMVLVSPADVLIPSNRSEVGVVLARTLTLDVVVSAPRSLFDSDTYVPIADVDITLVHEGTGLTLHGRSDQSGLVRLPGAVPGRYKVERVMPPQRGSDYQPDGYAPITVTPDGLNRGSIQMRFRQIGP